MYLIIFIFPNFFLNLVRAVNLLTPPFTTPDVVFSLPQVDYKPILEGGDDVIVPVPRPNIKCIMYIETYNKTNLSSRIKLTRY